jgi:two-component system sensor histidine kinase AlgZ
MKEGSGWHAVVDEFRDTSWMYVVVPPALTAFFAAAGLVERASVPAEWFANQVVMLSIGATLSLVHLGVLGPVARRLGLDRSMPLAWAVRTTSVAVGVVVGADLSTRILAAVGIADDSWDTRWGIVRIGAVVSAVLLGVVAMRQREVRRRQIVEAREAGARDELVRARLQALQARTDPHFLFNALNTVAALVAEDPVLAERAIERLSDLFRYALEGSRRDRVPLRDELAAVDDTLFVEGLRFGDRLTVVRRIDADVLELPIPPLVLQPLVENAIGHGLAPRRTGGTVTIVARRDGSSLVLAVDDDGVGASAPPSRGAGTTHADLRRRLALAWGARATFRAGPLPAGGYRAELRLPMEDR